MLLEGILTDAFLSFGVATAFGLGSSLQENIVAIAINNTSSLWSVIILSLETS